MSHTYSLNGWVKSDHIIYAEICKCFPIHEINSSNASINLSDVGTPPPPHPHVVCLMFFHPIFKDSLSLTLQHTVLARRASGRLLEVDVGTVESHCLSSLQKVLYLLGCLVIYLTSSRSVIEMT